MRIRDFLLIALGILVVASCATPQYRDKPDEMWVGELVSYQKAVAEGHGTLGYVKIFDYRREGYPEPMRLFHVYDLEMFECGILTPMGTGHKIVRLPVEVARVRGMTQEKIPLEAQALPFNVARCLDVDPEVKLKLVPATQRDFKPAEN